MGSVLLLNLKEQTMKVSKFLVTAISTGAVVGAIGLAYAQTDPNAGSQAPASPAAAQPSTPSDSSSSMNNSSSMGTSSTEQPARADRG